MGIPYRRSRTTLEEAVTHIRALLSGERISTSEGVFDLTNVGLAIHPKQSQLPIYLAAIGPKALRLAGQVADGVLLNAYVPPAYIRYAVDEVRSAAASVGRDPHAIDIACMLVVRMTDDPASQWPSLKERLVRLLAEPYVGEILLEKGGFDPEILPSLRATSEADGERAAIDFISDAMVESFYLVGPAEQCKERITAYYEAGVDQALLLPRLPDYRAVAEALIA